MLETIELTKIYEDGVVGVDHLNLKVEKGEVFCLLGANGAGKTTTINLCLGFIDPTEGTAKINGIDVVKDPLEAKKYVAYVSENVMLYGNFTALQNLEFFTRLGGRRNVTRDELENVLRRVGLPEVAINKRVKYFSKGMRQRLGLAIAIAKNADVLLLDEPTAGLDPRGAREFLEILFGLRDEGKAILMSTHDIFRAKIVADRVGIMKEGYLIATMKQDELKLQDLEQLYLQYMDVDQARL